MGRIGMPLTVIGAAHFYKREFGEAASKLVAGIRGNPGIPIAYRILAVCYAQMGRHSDAREIVTRLREITPQVVPTDLPLRNPQDRELFLSGLRLAAGEKT